MEVYRKKDGYFTDFVNQNKLYEAISPIYGNERDVSFDHINKDIKYLKRNRSVMVSDR